MLRAASAARTGRFGPPGPGSVFDDAIMNQASAQEYHSRTAAYTDFVQTVRVRHGEGRGVMSSQLLYRPGTSNG